MSIDQVIVEILSWVLILGGSFLTIVGAFGMLRFPNFWARLHASSVTDSGGVILLLAGMAIQAGWSLIAVKLIFILIFLFVTGPTASHAIANSALVSGLKPPRKPRKGTKK